MKERAEPMLQDTSLSEQIEAAGQDPLRVLIVGAGVAGVCIARLLREQGLHPVLLERAQARTGGGYMLGLMPLVDEPLRRAGVWEEYRDRSVAMHRYRLSSRHGREARTYSFDSVLCAHGRYGGIERGELIQLMSGGSLPVSFGTSVGSVGQDELGATVGITTEDGLIDARFDLVIAADGMHSTTRDLVVDAGDVEEFDTGWGGWVVWADADPTQSDLYAETWGRGFFIGRYPLRDKVGVFLGGPRTATAVGPAAFGRSARNRLSRVDQTNAQAFSAIGAARDPYYWKLSDTRCNRWARGRVVLLGDAAAGFLPTAGIGAAMALESAAVLAAQPVSKSR